METKLLTRELDGKYDEFLLSQERSLFNASTVFRNFILRLCPDALPYYFVAMEGSEIVGVLPSFVKKGPLGPVLNSMPWFGANPGVVVKNDDPQIAYSLMVAMVKASRWMNCFSMTFIEPPTPNPLDYSSLFGDQAFSEERIGMITPLPPFAQPQAFAENLMKVFHPKTRNQVIKSIECCDAYESYMDEDWTFLKEKHREGMLNVGAPVKEKEFDIIRRNLLRGNDYKLYVAFTKGENPERAGALLVEYFNKTVEYITPVVDVNYRHLCPMNLLIFSAMGDAAQRGMKWWNWGGTKLPSQEGVYHFKKRFGAVESRYRYHTCVFGDILVGVKPSWLRANYPYFYVMPYSLLE